MAAIAVLVANLDFIGAPAGQYRIMGLAVVDESPVQEIQWEAFVNFTDSTLAVNSACKDAAIAAAQAAGLTINPSDQKTLFASAVLG